MTDEVLLVKKESLESVADAIRSKTGELEKLEFPNEFVSEIERLEQPEGVWVKPTDWPDIEVLPFPQDETVSCLYFLLDCTTEVRYANVMVITTAQITKTAYKYSNGTLVEDITLFDEDGYIELPRDVDYCILKVEGAFRGYCFPGNIPSKGLYRQANNIGSNVPCVAIYGRIYSDTQSDMYINQSGGTGTIMLKRVKLYLNDNVMLGYGFKYFNCESCVINDGECKGLRLLNNSSSILLSGDKTELVLHNLHLTRNSLSGLMAGTIDLDGLSNDEGRISLATAFSGRNGIKKISIRTNGLIITSLYWAFAQIYSLKILDMTGCDFSELSTSGVWANWLRSVDGIEELYLGDHINTSIDISSLCNLSHNSLVNGVIAKLAPTETTLTLTLSEASKAKLTAEEIAIATEKGWTVA